MLGNLNYTKKSYVLLAGLLIFFYLGYQFSFSDTLHLKASIKEKKEKLEWLKKKEKELPVLQTKIAEFEKVYTKDDSLSVRDKLTAYISEFAEQNSCIVTEIPSNSSFKNNNLNVQTNTFTIKGNFKELLSLLYEMETEHRYLAKVMSAQFYTIKDVQARKKNLYLTIITQSFEQKTS